FKIILYLCGHVNKRCNITVTYLHRHLSDATTSTKSDANLRACAVGGVHPVNTGTLFYYSNNLQLKHLTHFVCDEQ
ncbi:MAG: hypothetical protein II307_01705, partial [Alistipes sp.]|nr:hypothetical protein [Alistipes sp.]